MTTAVVEVLVKHATVSEVVAARGSVTVDTPAAARAVSIEASPQVVVVEVGVVGQQGPPGPAAPDGGSAMSVTADQPIGGHRVVRLEAGNPRYADCTQVLHANTVLGVTTGAASVGGALNVVRSGEVDEPSWAWTPNLPVYLGEGGVLTQAPPEGAAFYLIVGFPVATTKLFVSIREPIVLTQQ